MLSGRMLVAVVGSLLGVVSCGNDDTATSSSDLTDGGGLVPEAGSLSGLQVIDPSCGAGDGGTEDACEACVATNCADAMESCFGAQWASNLAGTCSTFGDCVVACDCGDPDCFALCVDQLAAGSDDACLTCVRALMQCEVDSCPVECALEAEVDSDAGRRDASP